MMRWSFLPLRLNGTRFAIQQSHSSPKVTPRRIATRAPHLVATKRKREGSLPAIFAIPFSSGGLISAANNAISLVFLHRWPLRK